MNAALHVTHICRGAARIFLSGGGWNYGSKSYEKEKLLVIRIAKKAHILWMNSWRYSPRNLGSFHLNCHLVSLIFFHDDRKTQPPWLHVSFAMIYDFFLLSESIFLTSTFSSFLQSLRNASNFSAQNWWYWRVWWDFNLLSPFSDFCELILPTCQGP